MPGKPSISMFTSKIKKKKKTWLQRHGPKQSLCAQLPWYVQHRISLVTKQWTVARGLRFRLVKKWLPTCRSQLPIARPLWVECRERKAKREEQKEMEWRKEISMVHIIIKFMFYRSNYFVCCDFSVPKNWKNGWKSMQPRRFMCFSAFPLSLVNFSNESRKPAGAKDLSPEKQCLSWGSPQIHVTSEVALVHPNSIVYILYIFWICKCIYACTVHDLQQVCILIF